jgi:hypothetical protein
VVYPSDTFILNFDADNVTVAQMEYYVNSRINRHHYMDMLPVLNRAIALKKQEMEDEKPFCLLLIGQIMKAHDIGHELIEPMIPELVRWWKFKNQTHRALMSDDALALKMIVGEFGVRRKRIAERNDITGDELVDKLVQRIKEQEPNVVLIGHKTKNEYVALVAHDERNVFVKEQLWAVNRSSNCMPADRIRLKESKDWRYVDTRWERWKILFQHERWTEWIRDGRKFGYLTEPEIQFGINEVQRITTEQQIGYWKRMNKRDFQIDNWTDGILPLGMALKHEQQDYINFYICDREIVVDEKELIHKHPHEPSIACHEIVWKRNPKGEVVFEHKDSHHLSIGLSNPPWAKEYNGSHHASQDNKRVLKVWLENIDKVHKQQIYAEYCKGRHRKLEYIARDAYDSITNQIIERVWAKHYAEYITEFGDPELWEEHKKTITVDIDHSTVDITAFNLLIERNIDCNGKTLQEIYDLAKPLCKAGKAKKRRHAWSNFDDADPIKLPKLKPENACLKAKHKPIPPFSPPGPGDVDEDDGDDD